VVNGTIYQVTAGPRPRTALGREATPFALVLIPPTAALVATGFSRGVAGLEEPRSDHPGVVQEVPFGLNSGGLGGVWKASETPMLLSTFEYITRGAPLRWWDELASARKERANIQDKSPERRD